MITRKCRGSFANRPRVDRYVDGIDSDYIDSVPLDLDPTAQIGFGRLGGSRLGLAGRARLARMSTRLVARGGASGAGGGTDRRRRAEAAAPCRTCSKLSVWPPFRVGFGRGERGEHGEEDGGVR